MDVISYLFFVDSDDLIYPRCLEFYLKKAQEFSLDLVVSGIDVEMDSGLRVPSFWVFKGVLKNQVLRGEEFFNQVSRNFFCSAWNVLIDFNFLKRINLYFIHGILYEDCAFGTLLFLQARRVMLLDSYLYIYVIRKGGITRPLLITQDRLALEFKSWYLTIKTMENFHLGKGMIHQHIKNYYLPMLYVCAFRLNPKERYLNQCKEFQYMSPRIFLARYFSRTFLFLRKIRNIYKKIFKIF